MMTVITEAIVLFLSSDPKYRLAWRVNTRTGKVQRGNLKSQRIDITSIKTFVLRLHRMGESLHYLLFSNYPPRLSVCRILNKDIIVVGGDDIVAQTLSHNTWEAGIS